MTPAIKAYVLANKDRFLEELFELLRFPSVSADPKHKDDMLKTAEFVAQKLRDAGADGVEVCPTAGHPIVYGEKIVDRSLPTVLVYGHYDVQPADPLELSRPCGTGRYTPAARRTTRDSSTCT